MYRQCEKMSKARESKKETPSGCFTRITKPCIHFVTRDTRGTYLENYSVGRTRRSPLPGKSF
jgi:hypothetical protein